MEQAAWENQPTTQRGATLPLGEAVRKHGLISDEQLAEALAYQRAHAPSDLLGKVLVDLGYVSQEDIVWVAARAVDVPFMKLDASRIEPEALKCLPARFQAQHNVLPVAIEGGVLKVATERFTDVFLLEDIAARAGMSVRPIAATAQNIEEVRQSVRTEEPEAEAPGLDTATGAGGADGELTIVEEAREEPADLEVAAADSPVVELVNQIIRSAIQSRASDIHIEPDDGVCTVRYRIDGALRDIRRVPQASVRAVASRIKIMSEMDISERRVPQDGHMTVMIEGRKVDLRVSTMVAKFGEKIVMRINDSQNALSNLCKLGLTEQTLEQWKQIIHEPHGLVLVTGPTGSGKTSTLYASLNEIADRRRNISTVEDPIEHNLDGVNQFEVSPRAGFGFPQALRSLVRQDPDIIMVGEVRDVETARLGVEASLTGHLVLTTLHTNDAPGAVTRLVNMGLEPYLVAAALRAVLAQRLVQRLCPYCAESSQPGEPTRRLFEHYLGREQVPEVIYASRGCARCRQTGVAGRTCISELLRVDEALLEQIGRGATLQEIRQSLCDRGFRTMVQSGLELAREGHVALDSLREVLGHTTLESASQLARAGQG